MKKVKKKCREDTLLLVDGGDITKPYGSKFEGLSQVRDGSTGKIGKGFPTVGVIALTDDKLPLPIYEKIYSYETEDFVSENHETFQALDFVSKYFSKDHIRVFDRGYDSSIVTDKLLESGVKFIVRTVGSRVVKHKGKDLSILEIAGKFKGKYRMDFTDQKGKTRECKIWITPIEMDGNPLNLVVCHGFGNKLMMLVTNIFDDDNSICVAVTKCYLMRWKIEEFYRFKKQTFHFEDIRVMHLKTMNTLNLLLNILIIFLSIKSTKNEDKPVIIYLVNKTRRLFMGAKNVLYAVCAGIRAIFSRIDCGLRNLFRQLWRPPAWNPPLLFQQLAFNCELFGS